MYPDIHGYHSRARPVFPEINPPEIRDIQYFLQPSPLINNTLANGKMIQYTLPHGTNLVRINVFIRPQIILVFP